MIRVVLLILAVAPATAVMVYSITFPEHFAESVFSKTIGLYKGVEQYGAVMLAPYSIFILLLSRINWKRIIPKQEGGRS